MGMGHGANHADVIEQDEIKKLVPDELDAFLKECEEQDCLENVAQNIAYDSEELPKEVVSKYDTLIKSFNDKTDLDLEIRFHDSSSMGDRYDDVDGIFWSLDGVYQLSPAGEKYEKIITRKFFVTFG